MGFPSADAPVCLFRQFHPHPHSHPASLGVLVRTLSNFYDVYSLATLNNGYLAGGNRNRKIQIWNFSKGVMIK
jgi:hypothetical protein